MLKLQALEFVLWSALAIDSSAPLMSPQFIEWRVQLYSTVAQCYDHLSLFEHASVSTFFCALELTLQKFTGLVLSKLEKAASLNAVAAEIPKSLMVHNIYAYSFT